MTEVFLNILVHPFSASVRFRVICCLHPLLHSGKLADCIPDSLDELVSSVRGYCFRKTVVGYIELKDLLRKLIAFESFHGNEWEPWSNDL
jgi:hypothetical protein